MAKKGKKLKKGCLAVIIVIVVIVAAWAGINFLLNDSISSLVPDRNQTGLKDDGVENIFPYRNDRINILVLGTDRGADSPSDAGRSDSIMLFNLDLKNKRVNAVSIPRDSRVDVDGYKNKTKINHAYAKGGIELTSKTVSNLLQVPVDYYVETNFAGFESIVDTLGGITIDVPIRMKTRTYYGMIDLKPGIQTLNGKDALGFVRYRYDAGGDIARAGRQQQFLKAIFEKMTSEENFLKLPTLVPQIMKAVDTDLTSSQLIALAKLFKDINMDTDMHTQVLEGKAQTISGASYWILDEEKMKQTVQEMFINDYVAPETEADPNAIVPKIKVNDKE